MLSDYTNFTLPNKLRVVSVPMEGISSATVLVLVGAGSRYEDKEKAGLSHFLEHMIFKGTQKRPSAFEISSLVDSVGAENNAFTSKDHTGYYIKIQNRHLELAFDILSDTLKNSLYLEEEINRERGTIIEEINLYEDTPLYKIDDVFYDVMFGDTPLGWSIAGSKETVSNIKREDFLSYTKRMYQAKDMVLVIAGNFKEEEAKKLSEKYFSSIVEGEKEKFEKFEGSQEKPRVKVLNKKTDQAHLYLGYPAFSFHDPDKTALNVASAILGGGMSSRFFIQVRERRGLAYYVRSSTDYFEETGLIAASAGVNLHKINEVVKVLLEEFGKVKKGDVSEDELKKAKEFLKGRLALRLENSRSVAGWYAEKLLLEREIETPDQVFEKIEKITTSDIERVANRVFDENKINLAVIGPYEDEKRFLELIS
ncbi:insulinase family protein [Candidatus Microgenomates bacterium]|jgi:predicted Zn-dependent peptidase|nr:MAG: insulinase family protein [Candidatus Microgenomates bacterium]